MTLIERFGLPPDEIERRSLALVESALPSCSGWTSAAREVVKRMVYAAGDLALAGMTHVHPDAVAAGLEAIKAKAVIVCDVRMVAAGLAVVDSPVLVAIDHAQQPTNGRRVDATDPATRELAEGGARARIPYEPSDLGRQTRVAQGIRRLALDLDGGIAIIGNAPTALLELLDMIDAGLCQPALIVATPVGFVAAAESKRELMDRSTPFVTVEGTRGGSPLAAAAMNALLLLSASAAR